VVKWRTFPDADAYSYSDSDADSNSDGDTHSGSDGHTVTDTNTYPYKRRSNQYQKAGPQHEWWNIVNGRIPLCRN
jgi:hypothetical protein